MTLGIGSPARMLRKQSAAPKSWSIGLMHGPSLTELRPAAPEPILTTADITDVDARLVADPFGIRVGNEWYLFFEVLQAGTFHGMIAAAKSRDLVNWDYLGVVLNERHHLSYPFVFEHDGEIFMIPESRGAREVNIYVADQFPLRWRKIKTILRGKYFDASVLHHDGKYWLFAGWWSYWLRLFHAPHPTGPWTPHTLPFIRGYSKGAARPGGRPILVDGKLIRFGQDNRKYYGHQLQAFEITALSPRWYSERPLQREPILKPTGRGWNAGRMHHMDLHLTPTGLTAFVDGSPETEP